LKKTFIYCAFLVFSLILANNPAYATDMTQKIFDDMGNAAKSNISSLDDYLDTTSKMIAKNPGISNYTLNLVLRDVPSAEPFVYDAAFVDDKGIIKAVQPDMPEIIGTDISRQDHVMKVKTTNSPALSKILLTAEDIWAIVFQHPVIDDQNDFKGSLSVLIKPKQLFGQALDDTVCVIDNGTVLYDRNQDNIGDPLMDDSTLNSMGIPAVIAKKITLTNSGSDNYLKTKISWTTINVYGRTWKMVRRIKT